MNVILHVNTLFTLCRPGLAMSYVVIFFTVIITDTFGSTSPLSHTLWVWLTKIIFCMRIPYSHYTGLLLAKWLSLSFFWLILLVAHHLCDIAGLVDETLKLSVGDLMLLDVKGIHFHFPLRSFAVRWNAWVVSAHEEPRWLEQHQL